MISYILGSLQATEKALRRQTRITAVALLVANIGFWVMTTRLKEKDKQIEKLNNELEELKRAEGE